MKTIVRKLYSHYEKEEKWLNAMSAKGLALTEYTWCRYVFEDCEPGEYIYRIELLENALSHPESKAYIAFMKESGIEHVSSYIRWVYFRKKAFEGAFDIYTDIDSRIKHYTRIIRLWGIIGLANLSIGIANFHTAFIRLSEYGTQILLHLYCLNLILGGLLIGLCIPYFRKITKLKKEKSLRE